MLVREVMTAPVATTRVDATVTAAVELLALHGLSSLPVVDSDHRVVGVVSVADLAATVVPTAGRACSGPVLDEPTRARVVAEVMVRDPVWARPTDDVGTAAARTATAGVRDLPVVDLGGHVVGLLSRVDLRRRGARRRRDRTSGPPST
ncbi:hypothetical protein GCM10009737_14760 [Nocardioides lentus]|uniref:CBS domain-containing protein n=1 Tax=Nocardioides lentus TaxID=338077 RepID=A0ABN2P8G1_9ACTN